MEIKMDQQQKEEFDRLYCLAVGIARNAGDSRDVATIVAEVQTDLGITDNP